MSWWKRVTALMSPEAAGRISTVAPSASSA